VLQNLVNLVVGLGGASGLWAWLSRRDRTRAATDRLQRGLAYREIVRTGFAYIKRGWLTADEYEEFRLYLYEPYKALGGNGVTERIMAEVTNLPMRDRFEYGAVLQEAKRSQTSDKPFEAFDGHPVE
jgi:hypothetical protein